MKEYAEEAIIDEGDDDDENEEEDVDLIPNKYLLDLDVYPPRKRKKYENDDFSKNKKFYLWSHAIMIILFLVSSIFMLMNKDSFENSLLIFILKLAFVIAATI